jgi:hypothetical protein
VSLFVTVQVPPARNLGGRDSPRRDTFQPGGRLVLPSAGLRLDVSFQCLTRGGKVLTAVCSSAASSRSPCRTRPYHPRIHARARPRAWRLSTRLTRGRPANLERTARARCCDCELLAAASCDPCAMTSHQRDPALPAAGVATFSRLNLKDPGRHYLAFRVEEFSPPDDDAEGGKPL